MDASFVLAVAEQIAVRDVKVDAAAMLAPRVEMHVKRLLQVPRGAAKKRCWVLLLKRCVVGPAVTRGGRRRSSTSSE